MTAKTRRRLLVLAVIRGPALASPNPVAAWELGSRGNVREDDRRCHRQTGTYPQQARVDRDVERPHREPRGIAAHDGHQGAGEQHAEHGARAAKHHALREQRAPQRTGARAESGPHGQLAFAAH